jgi:metal-responsive CopG/Arc/MetJ family transcriptional regulator
MEKTENSKKRVTLNLDKQTLETLSKIVEENAYDTISSAIRIMVKKYAKLELHTTE